MPSQLAIYLRSHEAGARAGYDLFSRTSHSQRQKPYAQDLRVLTGEIKEDLDALRALMAALDVHPDPVLGGAARLAERVGRLKPNGHVVRRAPVSDLIELEGCLDAVAAKSAAWQALDALGVDVKVPPGTTGWPGCTTMVERAESQVGRLQTIHRSAARPALTAT